MKHYLLLVLTIFITGAACAQSKGDAKHLPAHLKVRYDGLYVAQTVTVATGADSTTIYNYIRFYKDGSVYTQAVNSYAPADVAKWLGKAGRFERKGKYTITGSRIDFTVNNSESEDLPLEGPMTDTYNGSSAAGNSLDLRVKYNDGHNKRYQFDYVKTD